MDFQIISKQALYSGFFKMNKYDLSNELYEGGVSQVYSREIFERGHAVGVLLYDRKCDKVILVEQFRPGAIETEDSPWLIEPVAGMIDANETAEAVARRESMEEAGCEIKRLQKICEYLVSPGGSTERVWLYLGEVDSCGISQYAGLEAENEDIKIHCISSQKAFDWLQKGRFTNAMSIIAVQWLKLNLLNKSDFWC